MSSGAESDKQARQNNNQRVFVAVALVLIAAAFFRFYGLSEVPRGLFRDEVVKGYSAFQLWESGRQVYLFQEQPFALSPILPAFMEEGAHFTSAIYQYLCAPFVGLFGLNAFVVRLPAAIAGLLTVMVLFFFTRDLEEARYLRNSERREVMRHAPPLFTALAAMTFLAHSPVHILFSRWAQQGITVPLWATIGLFCLLKAASADAKHQRAFALLGGFFLAVAFYSYAPARVVIPLILLGLWWELGMGFRRLIRVYWPAATVFLIIAVPVTVYFVSVGASRFEAVSAASEGSIFQTLLRVAGNYSLHFDPRFLFLFGDANPRHSMPFSGVIAWAEIPFFITGILVTVIGWQRPGSRLLLVWILSAPAAAALTNDGLPHVLRSILFFPVVHLISARGGAFMWSFGKKKMFRVLPLAAAATVTTGLSVYGLFIIKARDYRSWSYGVLDALQEMDNLSPNESKVLSAEIPFAVYYALFDDQTVPDELQENGFENVETRVLAPGTPLPEGALLVRPPRPFEHADGNDIVAGKGDSQILIFKIEEGW